jgi:hypothetical protein
MLRMALEDQFREAVSNAPLGSRGAIRANEENSMLDLIMLTLGLGFFAAALGYTYACERL